MLEKVAEYAKKKGVSRNYMYVQCRPGGKYAGAVVRKDGQMFIDTDLLPRESKAPEQPEDITDGSSQESLNVGESELLKMELAAVRRENEMLLERLEDKQKQVEYLQEQLSNAIKLSGMQAQQLQLIAAAGSDAPEHAQTQLNRPQTTERAQVKNLQTSVQKRSQGQQEPHRSKPNFIQWILGGLRGRGENE